MAGMVTNGHFGHSGQPEMSENGLNGFPMPKNLGIDTKMKSLTGSEPKLQIWPFYLIMTGPKWPQIAILATQVNPMCLKMVPIDFPYPKT